MTIAVLLILLALWLAVLAPPVLRFVSGERRRADAVGDFNQALSVLGRTNGHRNGIPRGAPPGGPRPGMTDAQRRRRDVLLGLLGAVAGSFVLAVAVGGPVLWTLQVVTDLLLVGYVSLLVQFRQRALERRAKVRYLPARATRDDDIGLSRVLSSR